MKVEMIQIVTFGRTLNAHEFDTILANRVLRMPPSEEGATR